MSRCRTPLPRRPGRTAAWLTAALLAVPMAACGGGNGAGRPAASATARPGPSAAVSSPAPTAGVPARAVSCAQQTLDRLDTAARAAQLLMVGVPATDPVGGYQEVAGVGVGGVFLRGRSSAGAAAVGAAVTRLQQASALPLAVAVDQEGGLVQTLTGPGFDTVPPALQQGLLPAEELRAEVSSWAGQLRGAGITMDLAPVADTVPAGTERQNPPIGAFDRQYGSDPGQVARSVSTVVHALQDAGVAATAKHFPGLGRVRVNTDTDPGATDPQTTATDPYLQPFAAAVTGGTAAVMVSSATYPQLDAGRPAVFSSAVVGLLRRQLGFGGVVVTDDLGQAVAVGGVPVGERATGAVAAGVDVVLTVRTEDAAPMAQALAARAGSDPAFATRVTESALRVLALKERFGQLRC
jgi:beta-N-acetylhexosaminidase